MRPLLRPLLFTVTFSGTCYAAATIVANRPRGFHPVHFPQKALKFRDKINRWRNSFTYADKIAASIIAINVSVFICCRVAPQSHMMARLFRSSVENLNGSRSQARIRCLPLLLSGFNHIGVLHLIPNMLAFNTFYRDTSFLMGPEHCLGMFLSATSNNFVFISEIFNTIAGVFSFFVSSAYRLLLRSQGQAMGASSGIMAMVYYTAFTNPEKEYCIKGIPWFTWNASTAAKCLFLLDTLGLLLIRWTWFDHAGHLAGAIFGILYTYYEHHLAVRYRSSIIDNWSKLRKSG